MFRIFNYGVSITFAIIVGVSFGYYVIGLSDLIPTNLSAADAVQHNKGTVMIGQETVSVELADTPETQALGLMHRTNLANNKGMLFIYDEPGYYSFWMKNTRIPLDIVWIDEDHTIVHIEHSVEPCVSLTCQTYRPSKPGKYVLEVSGGWMREKGFNVGQTVILDF